MGGSLARLRKRWRAMAPLEALLTGLAYVTYAAGAFSVFAAFFLATSIGESEKEFPVGEGFLKAIKGYGVGFFAVAAIVCYYVARWLLDSRVAGARKEIAARYEASRMATEIAGNADFQRAGSWEWRERIAYEVVPELKEYAESDVWADRRFAHQTIKEAWELHLRSKERD